jgi:hypothetical protein
MEQQDNNNTELTISFPFEEWLKRWVWSSLATETAEFFEKNKANSGMIE